MIFIDSYFSTPYPLGVFLFLICLAIVAKMHYNHASNQTEAGMGYKLKEDSQQVTFRLNTNTKKRFKLAAHRNRKRISDVLRELVEQYVEANKTAQQRRELD